MLDEAGWPGCTITCSNSLDEYLIKDLISQGAKIDSFGVGERLITARSEPVFGGVYKLVAVERSDGEIVPRIKVSENVQKITVPHFKKIYRFYGRDNGKALADYMCLRSENVDDTQDITIFDPETIIDKATFADPQLAPEGISRVILNGKTALIGQTIVDGGCGQYIRRP